MIKQIRKRNGKIVPFDRNRIFNAILKAFRATKLGGKSDADKVTNAVVNALNERYKNKIPGVEEIQDVVEEFLVKLDYNKVASAYDEYRKRRARIREMKKLIGVYDDMKLTVNAIKVLSERYLLKNDSEKIIETPSQMLRRVARVVAQADKGFLDYRKSEEEFYNVMRELKFLPNSPTLMNAGAPLGQLAACFVLPVEDSIVSIFDSLKYMAMIHQSGGGTGFNFSHLRPKGDIVHSTKGVASGPVSFMEIYDKATDVIKQGGKRRGANMGVLNYNHPDILEFITAKLSGTRLQNFNISVGVSDDFMRKVEKGQDYWLINPRNGEKVRKVNARSVFDLIVSSAWQSGDPGILFLDEINRRHPLPWKIESTNPCGEQPLLPFESCNLGSINLSKFVVGDWVNKKGRIDWDELGRVVRIAVRFLDNVITVNKFPLPQIEEVVKKNRKIGLGVMGWAEMLIKLWIPYDSEEAISLAKKVMKFITQTARDESSRLGKLKGNFPHFKYSKWYKDYDYMRNATVTTIAPTGTISIIAGTSSGIEPLFAISYLRDVLGGLLETNPFFEEIARERGFYSEDLIKRVATNGNLKEVDVPKDVKRVFKTALEIDPVWHVKMQAAFQKYTDNAVSKTVNLPEDATVDDVRKVYLLAWKLKCKGITIYRYGSKKKQVLYIGKKDNMLFVPSEYGGGCPLKGCAH